MKEMSNNHILKQGLLSKVTLNEQTIKSSIRSQNLSFHNESMTGSVKSLTLTTQLKELRQELKQVKQERDGLKREMLNFIRII